MLKSFSVLISSFIFGAIVCAHTENDIPSTQAQQPISPLSPLSWGDMLAPAPIWVPAPITNAVLFPTLPQALPQEIPAPTHTDTRNTYNTYNTYTEDDLNILSELIYFEARDQSQEGQIAVGHVVLNRVKSSRYLNSIREVAHVKNNVRGVNVCHFEYHCKYPTKTIREVPVYYKIREVAKNILLGTIPDPTGGSTLYFNPDVYNIIPQWATSICTVYNKTIDAHEFYDQFKYTEDCYKHKETRFSLTKENYKN